MRRSTMTLMHPALILLILASSIGGKNLPGGRRALYRGLSRAPLSRGMGSLIKVFSRAPAGLPLPAMPGCASTG